MIPNKLVPKHELLSDEEAEKVLEKYSITKLELPRIKLKDPALDGFGHKLGDVIRITRENAVTGTSYYYRVVIDG
ncbi:MAG: DNA-directed RNA polymerase subunit H [Candidatus Altiarchaeota archaeon]